MNIEYLPVSGEWELTPEELSVIFSTKGWPFYVPRVGLIPPTPDVVESTIGLLVKEVIEERKDRAQKYRFLVQRNPDTPKSFDIYLGVGFVWDSRALGGEEVAA